MVDIVATDTFSDWFTKLSAKRRDDITAVVELLAERGVHLGYPRSSDVKGSKLGRLRELRIQSQGDAIRILYAFDPHRQAVLLVGDIKKGTERRFYKRMIDEAEKLYDEHLKGS